MSSNGIFLFCLSLCFVRNIHTRILTCNQKSCVAVRLAPAVEVPVACGIREGVGSVYVVTVITGTAAKSSNRSGEPSSRFRSRGRWLLTRLLLSVVALLNANPGGSENTVASEGSLLRISQLFEIMRQMLYSSDVVTQVAMLWRKKKDLGWLLWAGCFVKLSVLPKGFVPSQGSIEYALFITPL